MQAPIYINYPELELGSNVKIYKTKKTLGHQEIFSRFMPTIFTLNTITTQHGQKCYNVEGKDRLYLRVELLKV